MAHFAKLDENNYVIFVTVGSDEDNEVLLSQRTGDKYLQTSYNTRAGIYYNSNTWEPSPDQSKALRKNFAAIGYFYDESRDAFIPPKPFDSWILNETTCTWNPPVSHPDDGKNYTWNELNLTWDETN